MAENRLTQGAALALTENVNARARFTQGAALALTENVNARARFTQVALLVLTDPPPTPEIIDYALANTDHDAYGILEVQDPDFAWRNVSNLGGVDFLTSVTLGGALDDNTLRLTAVLARESNGLSLAPLMQSSGLNVRTSTGTYAPLLDVQRQWRLKVAIMGKGLIPADSDYHVVAVGIIDDVDWGNDSEISVTGRDLGAKILDSYIRVNTRDYSIGNDQFMEQVIQQELDDQLGVGAVTLYVPAPTLFVIKGFLQDYGGLMDAVTGIAELAGYALRYRRDLTSAGAFRFMLTLPNRNPSAVDWTIGPTAYLTLPTVKMSLSGVRTFVEVKCIDGVTGELILAQSPAPLPGTLTCAAGAGTFSTSQAGVVVVGAVLVVDGTAYTVLTFDGTTGCTLSNNPTFAASPWTTSDALTRFGMRYMGIDQRNGSQINTLPAAQQMADAARSDLEFPALEQEFETYGTWFVQLGDYIQMAANGVHYDTPQFGGVTAFTHTLANGVLRTRIALRGKPAGRYRTWLSYGAVTSAFTSPELNVFVTPGDSSYSIAWSGVGVTLSIDGAAPTAPPASPIVVVRDAVDHLYHFAAADGTIFPVVIPAAFAVGPEISYTTDVAGNLTVYVDGKPEADRTYVAVRTDHRPAVVEILPPSEGAGNLATVYGEVGPGISTGRCVNIALVDASSGATITSTQLPVGKKFFVGAVSLTVDGRQSQPSYINDVYLGVNATPAPSFAFGSYSVSDRLVTFPALTLSPAVQRAEFFVAESNSDPSPGTTTPPSVEGLVPEVEDWIERHADGSIDTAISFPIHAPGDYLSITAVLIDHLHRRGQTVTIKVQAGGAPITPPAPPTVSDPPISVTSNLIGFRLTLPGGLPTPDTLRAFVNGVQQPDVLLSSLASGVDFLVNGTPGSSLQVSAQLVVSGTGATSGMSNVVVTQFATDTSGGGAGTGTNGKLATPTSSGGSATWDATSQIMLIPFSTGTMPSGTFYKLQRATAYTGVYTEVSSGAVASPYEWDGESPDPFVDQHIYYKIVASCSGYTDSDPSVVIAGIVRHGRA